MADFKGLKFRAYNAATSRMVELMGASPTTVNSGDVPQAFGTGLIEAMITSPATGVDSQAWDFVKYYYDVQAFIPKNVTMVNARAFNSLPPAVQKAVTDAAAAAEKRGWDTARAKTSILTKTLADKGMTVGKTPAAIETDLAKIGATMADDWLKKAGAEGKAVLDAARR
jgi:TRAP-type C4-dicarboxylate transport system substrate-binding protein